MMKNTNRYTRRTIRKLLAAVAVSVVTLASFSAQAAQQDKASFIGNNASKSVSNKALSSHPYQSYVVPAGFSININLGGYGGYNKGRYHSGKGGHHSRKRFGKRRFANNRSFRRGHVHGYHGGYKKHYGPKYKYRKPAYRYSQRYGHGYGYRH